MQDKNDFFRGLFQATKNVAARLALESNFYGLSTRLAPAYINNPEFDKENQARLKSVVPKIEKFWVEKIGGTKEDLMLAIKEGWKKEPKVIEKLNADAEQSISELIEMAKRLSEDGIKESPFKEKKESYGLGKTALVIVSGVIIVWLGALLLKKI